VRLFVAIDIGESTRAQLRVVRDALTRQLTAAPRAPRVTWVADDAAHVTLRFIGEVPDATADRVRAALLPSLAHAPYDLVFSGVGTFPNRRRPRVVWIGTVLGQEETARLAAVVQQRLEPILGNSAERAFRAHLTVARVKEPVPFDWDGALSNVTVGGTVSRIDHVTLYQSKTSPKGPTYTALCVTPLAESRLQQI
jgi:RNA 2',3'-cyclic 3'-phosphodiesterase